jgi:hypothetical protein
MKALEDIESYGDFDLRRYLGDLTYRSESIHDNVFRRSRAIDKDRDKKMRLNIDELKVELQAIAEERKRPLKRDETHEWFLREYRDGRFSYLFNKEPNEDEFNVGYSLRIKNKDLKDNFLRSFLHALSFQPLDTQSSASDLISQTRAKRNFYLTSGQVWVLNEYRRGKFSYLLAIHDKAEFLKALDDTKETFLGRLMYALAWQPMETPGTAPDSMPITGNTRNFFLNRAQINSLKDSGYFYLLEIKDGAEFRKALDALNDYYLCRRLFITSWQAMDTEETVRGRYHELRQEVLADTDESRLTATIDRSSSPYLN